MPTVTNRKAIPLIASLAPFTNAGKSFHAEIFQANDFWGRGRMEKDAYLAMREANSNASLYVVSSYRTVIAYRPFGGLWVYLEAHYSPTTSRHQTLVRQAIGGRWEGSFWVVD